MLWFLPELCEDTLLQAQILVSVLLYHSSLPLNRVFQTPHGLSQFTADFLLCTLQLDSQRLLVLELKGRAAKQVLVWPEDQITEVGKVQTRSQVQEWGKKVLPESVSFDGAASWGQKHSSWTAGGWLSEEPRSCLLGPGCSWEPRLGSHLQAKAAMRSVCVVHCQKTKKQTCPILIYMHMLDQISCHVTSDNSHMVSFNFL